MIYVLPFQYWWMLQHMGYMEEYVFCFYHFPFHGGLPRKMSSIILLHCFVIILLAFEGQPISHVEYGMFAPWIDQFKTSTNSKSKGVAANYSKKSQSSIQRRSVWILDACFVIDLLQEPRIDDERTACDAFCKAFQHMQEQGAKLDQVYKRRRMFASCM